MNNPMFTIIIPVYNGQNHLSQLDNCLQTQTFKDFEAIFVDDGSTDGSLHELNKMKEATNNYKVFSISHKSACSARNFGLKHAKGKYICYIDCDDQVPTNYLSSLNEIICRNNFPEMIVFKFSRKIKGEEEPQGFEIDPGLYSHQSKMSEIIKPYMFKDMLNNKFILNSCNVCYSKDLLNNHFCKDDSIVNGEDWAYSYECLYYAKSVYFLDKSLYVYNDVLTSVSNEQRNTAKRLEDFCKLMNYIGQSFSFETPEINNRFAECVLYGISKLINRQNKINDAALENNIAESCITLIKKAKPLLKTKDRLYSIKLTKQIRSIVKVSAPPHN